MNSLGFVRVTAASHRTHVADPRANAQHLCDDLEKYKDSQVVVFGELSLTGYTCADLFSHDLLLKEAIQALGSVVATTRHRSQLIVVGLPIRVAGKLYNAAAAIAQGNVLAIIPKQYLANYHEFYE